MKVMQTFDYELFLTKRSSLVNDCILQPTEGLIDFFDEYGGKATFFVDTVYLQRLLEIKVPASKEDYSSIKDQLVELVSKGHRIELHLHPHWIDARYSRGEWFFDSYNRYRLHALQQKQIIDMFVSGKQLLEDIGRQAHKSYQVISFRAGGWCIQPFLKVKPGFEQAGIKIDCSVQPKFKKQSLPHNYDFSDANLLSHYFFSEDPLVPDIQGDFLEIPVSVFEANFFDKLTFLRLELEVSFAFRVGEELIDDFLRFHFERRPGGRGGGGSRHVFVRPRHAGSDVDRCRRHLCRRRRRRCRIYPQSCRHR